LILTSYTNAGKSDVAFSLLTGFINKGYKAHIVTPHIHLPEKDISAYSISQNSITITVRRIKLLLNGIIKGIKVNDRYYFQDKYEVATLYNTRKILKKVPFNPDAILICYNQGFLSAKNIYLLNKITGAPVFLYSMDMSPITGGCHYAWDCNGFTESCGNCPGLFSKKENDLSRRILFFRKKYFDKTNIHVISASDSLEGQFAKSILFKGRNRRKILLGFDASLYIPADKKGLRIKLNIPVDRKVIFFASVGLKEERKGLKYLIEALKHLEGKIKAETLLLLVAGKNPGELLGNLEFEVRNLGYLNEPEFVQAFQLSDVFASPSIEDSGPSTVNMSVLTGTPVVAFDVGVSRDLIKNGESGFIVESKDTHAFSKALVEILTLEEVAYRILEKNTRAIALEKCSKEKQVSSVLKYFNDFLD
jgi:glycosyltransferase involved in cell wall biosynthesis